MVMEAVGWAAAMVVAGSAVAGWAAEMAVAGWAKEDSVVEALAVKAEADTHMR